MEHVDELRLLAWWCRKLVERATDPVARANRQRTAEFLEIQAVLTERTVVSDPDQATDGSTIELDQGRQTGTG